MANTPSLSRIGDFKLKDLYVGIEIGATKQQIALGDGSDKLLEIISEKIALPNGAEDIKNWLLLKVPLLIGQQEKFGGKVRAMGVGFGGPLETSSGRVIVSVQVKGWKDFALKEWFEKKFNLPAAIVNDTVSGGYAELIYGSGKDSCNFFYTNIGSGIGGALFFDRKYYDGLGCGAAYFGHTYIPDWQIAGKHTKLENICSGFAIERRLMEKGYVPATSLLFEMCHGKTANLTCKMLEEAGYEGDEFAIQEINRTAFSYSIALANFITLCSPDTVSIGGGVSNMGDIFLDPVRQYTDDLVFVSGKGAYKIVQTTFKEKAVLVGAVLSGKTLLGR
jgi:glucokinase